MTKRIDVHIHLEGRTLMAAIDDLVTAVNSLRTEVQMAVDALAAGGVTDPVLQALTAEVNADIQALATALGQPLPAPSPATAVARRAGAPSPAEALGASLNRPR